MKYTLLLLLFSCSLFGQDEKVIQFRFSSHEGMEPIVQYIIVRPDSTFIGVDNRVNDSNKVTKRLTSAKAWSKLINSISNYKLEDLKLSNKDNSAYDNNGASFITITTNKKTYNSDEFGENTPNEKLEKLMRVLLEMKDNKL
ncbi:MAG: hypothetical protein ACYDCN_11725 [Bacteroidia bacterium]